MTDTQEKILAAYRDADFNRRLHMDLQYPRLRSEFMHIDQGESASQACSGLAPRDHSRAVKAGARLSARVGCVRRLWNAG